MTDSRIRFMLAVLPAAALVACGGGGGEPSMDANDGKSTAQAVKSGNSTQTAQAIWSDFGAASSEIVVTENRKYDFQQDDFCQGSDVSARDAAGQCAEGTAPALGASSYFNPASVTAAAWTCSGSATNCADSNRPAATPTVPPAPMQDLLDQAKCALWWGELLTPVSADVKSGTVNGSNGKGSWTYTWTFTATPTDTSAPAAPHSGYGYKILGDAGTVDVTLDGYVFGESAQSLAKGTRKYSFSMRASDGSVRVINTLITVSKDGAPFATFSQADGTLLTALQENLQANNDFLPVDFAAPPNPLGTMNGFLAIRNYDLKLLTFGMGARDILNNTGGVSADNFPGNDNGGADGSALARVKLAPIGTVSLDGGTYTVTYNGQVKELNADGSLQGFKVERTIKVVGEPGTCKRN